MLRRAGHSTIHWPIRCMVARPRRRENGGRAIADRFRIPATELTDVPAVHAIEQRVFADPWSTQEFRDCVSFALFLVAEEQDTIAGYVVALEAADEGEILNL